MMDYSSPGCWEALRPHVLSAVACLPLLSAGISIAYPATALPQLQAASGNSTFTLSDDEASWFTSVFAAAAPLGGLLAAALLDRLGRRALLLLCDAPSLLGWLLVARAPHTSTPLAELLAARALAGLSLGAALASSTAYLLEVLAPRSPRRLLAWPGLMLAAGALLGYCLAAAGLAWDLAAYASAAAPCLSALLVAWRLPESPPWLRLHGRPGDADWALQKLRLPAPPATPPRRRSSCPGCDKRHDNCLFCAERFRDASSNPPREDDVTCKSFLQVFFTWRVLRILAAQLFLAALQASCGVLVVLAYLAEVAGGLGVDQLPPRYLAVACGALAVSSVAVVGLLEPRHGLRAVLLWASSGAAMSSLFLSFHLTVLRAGGPAAALPYYRWVPLAGLLSFVLFSSSWLFAFPWLDLAEEFPPEVRGTVGHLALLAKFSAGFANLRYFPLVDAGLAWYYLCLVNTSGAVLGFLFWPRTESPQLGVMGQAVIPPGMAAVPEEERLLTAQDASRS